MGLFLYLDKYFLTTEIKMRLPVSDMIVKTTTDIFAAMKIAFRVPRVLLLVFSSPHPLFLVHSICRLH